MEKGEASLRLVIDPFVSYPILLGWDLVSVGLLGKYLDVVVGESLVHIQNSNYELTKCGRGFLNVYRRFEERYLRAKKSLESLYCKRELLTRFCEGFKRLDVLNRLGVWSNRHVMV